jgi:hypothetical protein
MAKIFESFTRLNQQRRQSSKNGTRLSSYGRSGRSPTGRKPGTVIDPQHDGRMHHGDEEVGLTGERLLTKEEWLASHHVPHPGARGNKNALGPHKISNDSLERIREGGRKGGKAHLGMRFEKIEQSKRKSGMSSRASGAGIRSSRGKSVSMNNSEYGNDRQRSLEEVKALSQRLKEVLDDLSA